MVKKASGLGSLKNRSSMLKVDERTKIILDAAPLSCELWDEYCNIIDCNQEAVNLFELSGKQEYLDRFFELSPEYQPNGSLSKDEALMKIQETFKTGRTHFEWMHKKLNGEPIPSETTMVRVESEEGPIIAAYTHDLRALKASQVKEVEANERARIMLDATPLCCNLWDENFNNIDCNQEAVNLFGLSSKQEYLDRFFELSPEYQPDGQLTTDKALKNIKEAFKTGRIRFEWMHQKLNGDPVPSEITLVRVKRGDVYIVAGYTRDLRELKASQAIADEANERTRIMFESTPLCCNFWDENFNNIDCNQEAVNLFELSSKQEYLDRFNELSPEYQPDGQLSGDKALIKIKEAFETGRTRFEWMHQKLNGDPVPSEITLVRVKRGDGYIVVGYTRDLRELKETVAMLNQLENIAFTDSLTGAYNRRYFIKKAEAEFQSFASTKKFIAIIMFDLDKFKLVNDTYGHPAGDEVLKMVTSVVQRTLRAEDLLARYGGEEFIILLRNMNQETVVRLATRIKDRVANSISNYMGTEIKITVSLGIAMRSERIASLEDVIKKADEALYKAKAQGRNRVEVYLEEKES